MKKKYEVKNKVWIHLGEKKLVEGRVVNTFTLEHLNEGHTAEEFYVIEIQTGIDNVYEVRTYNQISETSQGPIPIYNDAKILEGHRYLKKIGVELPVDPAVVAFTELVTEIKPESKSIAKKKFYRKKKTQ